MNKELLDNPVITTIDKNIAVSAGAGSGKTFSLANRFVYILLSKVNDPSFKITDIMAVTFTRMAATEMKERVRNYLREETKSNQLMQKFLDDYDKAQITTIDSMESRILRENPVESGLDPDFVVTDEELYKVKLDEITSSFLQHNSQSQEEDLQLLLKFFSATQLMKYLEATLKDRKIMEEEYSETQLLQPYEVMHDEVESFIRMAKKYIIYADAEKQRLGIIVHDDVTRMCLKLLRDNENIRHQYQQKIKYLMVDEFQDTNDSQREIFYLLCGDTKKGEDNGKVLPGNKLFVVGDIKQSIYKFRGADVSVFEKVKKAISSSGGEILAIKKNYRSTDKILRLVNAVFGDETMFGNNNFEALEPIETNCLEINYLPVFKLFIPTSTAKNVDYEEKLLRLEAEKVACRIEYLVGQGAVYGDIAVLLPIMTKVRYLTDAFVAHGIPYVKMGGRGFYKQQEIYDILNVFRYLADAKNKISLVGILRSPYVGWSDKQVTEMLDSGNDVNSYLPQFLTLRAAAEHLALPELWDVVENKLHISSVLLRQSNGEQKLANVRKLQDMCLEYCEMHQCSLAEWIDYVDSIMMDSKETEANLPAKRTVKIMTIHKSKGLQFDHVILPFLSNSKGNSHDIGFCIDTEDKILGIKWPNMEDLNCKSNVSEQVVKDMHVWEKYKQKNDALDFEEEKRKLYVAMTRAKKTLYMSGCRKNKDDLEIGKTTVVENSTVKDKSFAAMLWRALNDLEWRPPQGKERKYKPVWKQKQGLVDGDIEELVIFEQDSNEEYGTKRECVLTDVQCTNIIGKKTETKDELNNNHQTYFTPSRLQSYLHCQRQYYYQYGCGLPGYTGEQNIANASTGGNKNIDDLTSAEQGTLIHTALEYYQGGKEFAWKKAVKNCGFEDKSTDSAKAMYLNYLDSDIFKTIPMEHEREVKFQLPIDDGVVFGGIIDCLYAKTDGKYGVVDYKTGKVPDQMNEGYAMQLAIYAKAVKKMRLGEVLELQLHYLQSCEASSIIDQDGVYAKALELAKEIQKKRYEQDFETNCAHCSNCDYAYLCPAAGLRQADGAATGGK